MPTLRTPGERARWIREEVLGLSIDGLLATLEREMGGEVKVPAKSTVSRAESGHAPLDVEFAIALAELSGVSLDWIYRGVDAHGQALDALARVRHALEAIEARYRVRPSVPDIRLFRRVPPPEEEG